MGQSSVLQATNLTLTDKPTGENVQLTSGGVTVTSGSTNAHAQLNTDGILYDTEYTKPDVGVITVIDDNGIQIREKNLNRFTQLDYDSLIADNLTITSNNDLILTCGENNQCIIGSEGTVTQLMGTTTAQTVDIDDDSNHVATTAWVRQIAIAGPTNDVSELIQSMNQKIQFLEERIIVLEANIN